MMFSNPRPRPRPGGGVLGGGGITPPSTYSAAPFLETEVGEWIWSWHLDNIAYDDVTNRIYVGAVNVVTSRQGILIYDSSGAYDSVIQLPDQSYIADDHNAVSVAIFDGKLTTARAGHNDTNELHVSVSTDTTPENLGTETVLTVGTGVTYTQMGELENGTVYLATRYDTYDWALFTSVDGNPANFVRQNDIISHNQQVYCRIIPEGNLLHVVAWQHPTNNVQTAVRGCIYYKSIAPGDAAVDMTSMAKLYDGSDGGAGSVRVFSVSSDATSIAFAEFTVGTHVGQVYNVMSLTGADRTNPADWTTEVVGGTDSSFYEPSHYTGSIDFVGGATDVLLKGEYDSADGSYTLSRMEHDGSSWTTSVLVTSPYHIVRPLSPRGEGVPDVSVVHVLPSFSSGSGPFTDTACATYMVDPTTDVPLVLFDTLYHDIAGVEMAMTYTTSADLTSYDLELPDQLQVGDRVTLVGTWASGTTSPTITTGGATAAGIGTLYSSSGNYAQAYEAVAVSTGSTVSVDFGAETTLSAFLVVVTRGTHDAASVLTITDSSIASESTSSGDLVLAMWRQAQADGTASPDGVIDSVDLGSTVRIVSFATTDDMSGGVTLTTDSVATRKAVVLTASA